MRGETRDWARWRRFFEARSARSLPRLEDGAAYADLPRSLARSLAIFQLGESGGGTVVEQAKNSGIAAADRDFCAALALFVAEEHRHANLLAMCVRMLGGELIRCNWTARMFVFFRRLFGLRTKIMVLLAAEVVGICYYHLIAARLPQGKMRAMLEEMVDDERAHLQFHCAFLRSQIKSSWHATVFRVAWRWTMLCATIVVLIDHRAALRDLGIGWRQVWRRCARYAWLAEFEAGRASRAANSGATTYYGRSGNSTKPTECSTCSGTTDSLRSFSGSST